MKKPYTTKVVVCRSGIDGKIMPCMNFFGLWCDDSDISCCCSEIPEGVEHFLFQFSYEEMQELLEKLLQAKERIDKKRG